MLRRKNGEALRDRMKSRAKALGLKNVRINNAGSRPLRTRPDAGHLPGRRLVHLRHDAKDIDEVLETHLQKGGRVERLMLKTTDKLPSDRAK